MLFCVHNVIRQQENDGLFKPLHSCLSVWQCRVSCKRQQTIFPELENQSKLFSLSTGNSETHELGVIQYTQSVFTCFKQVMESTMETPVQ